MYIAMQKYILKGKNGHLATQSMVTVFKNQGQQARSDTPKMGLPVAFCGKKLLNSELLIFKPLAQVL